MINQLPSWGQLRGKPPVLTICRMRRTDLIETIILAKLAKKLTWKALAEACGRSEVWTTSALLGQQAMSGDEAGGRRGAPRARGEGGSAGSATRRSPCSPCLHPRGHWGRRRRPTR